MEDVYKGMVDTKTEKQVGTSSWRILCDCCNVLSLLSLYYCKDCKQGTPLRWYYRGKVEKTDNGSVLRKRVGRLSIQLYLRVGGMSQGWMSF